MAAAPRHSCSLPAWCSMSPGQSPVLQLPGGALAIAGHAIFLQMKNRCQTPNHARGDISLKAEAQTFFSYMNSQNGSPPFTVGSRVILKVESRELIQSAPPIDYAGRQQEKHESRTRFPRKVHTRGECRGPTDFWSFPKNGGSKPRGNARFMFHIFPSKNSDTR